MAVKVKNKKYNLSKIEAEFTLPELLDVWKKWVIAETFTRKNAFKSLSNFKTWWSNYLQVAEYNDKINCVAEELERAENLSDAEKDWLSERNRIHNQLDERFKNLEPIEEMMHKNKKQVFKFLSNPELKKYEVKIKQTFFWNLGHRRSPEVEDLLNRFDGITPYITLYKTLKKYHRTPYIYDKKGNKVPGNITWDQAFTSNDRYIRRQTYYAWMSVYHKNMQTMFNICKYLARYLNNLARAYNYKNWIDEKAQAYYEISLEDYEYMASQSVKFVDLNKKYMAHNTKLIMDAFGISEYAPWDWKIQIKNTTDNITIPEAKKLVLEGLSCLGDEYIDKIKICYKNNIIDWKRQPNADASSYCMSVKNTYDENIILFNWQGTSVCTTSLAHELGHNIRNKFMKENNEINNWTNRLTSEIPSMVNTVLMSLFLIKKFKDENKPKEQLYGIYKNFIDYMVYCINEMSFYSHYCRCFTRHAEENRDLRWNDMPELYFDLRKKYYGMSESTYNKAKKRPYHWEKLYCYDAFFNIASEWANQFVYYIGGVIAMSIGYKIFNGDKKTIANYYKFLKAGTTLDPVKGIYDTLGINLLKPEIYTESKKILEGIVNQFIKDFKI